MGDDTLCHTMMAAQLTLFSQAYTSAAPPQEKNGTVYTKPWVVELILDLAGYTSEVNLVDQLAIEPAAGQGAFLVPMARRLVSSCMRQNRPLLDIAASLLAYELDEASATSLRTTMTTTLTELGIPLDDALYITNTWIRTGDYLLEGPGLPSADFVIGNPPYIRLEDIDESIVNMYRAIYHTMRGRADIYVAFFEAALHRLKPDGVCAFICPDRWMMNQYGAELRRLVTQGFSVEFVTEMHNTDAFAFEVTAYPAITVIRRGRQGKAVMGSLESGVEEMGGGVLAAFLHTLRSGADSQLHSPHLKVTQVNTWFQGAGPWPCVKPSRLTLLRQLEEEFLPLESSETGTKVGIGVATGLDKVYITTDFALVEPERLLPLAMSADIVNGKLKWSGHYLIDPWQASGLVELKDFPRLHAYFKMREQPIRDRYVARRNPQQWYRTIDRVNHQLVTKHKLYIPDIQNRINPVIDKGQTYPHHNLYFVQSDSWDLEVLGGLLLSDVAQFFVECYCVRMRGGYFRFQAQYLRRIRVPSIQDITDNQKALLIEAFRTHDVSLATATAFAIYHISEIPLERV